MAKTTIINANGNNNGTQDSPFRVNAIRDALVAAHNNNNSKAIDAKMIKEIGISEDTLKAWETRCESFRVFTVKPFVDTFFNEVYEQEKFEERKKLEDAIFPEWKELLRSGEEDLIHKTLRPDPYDLYLIFKFGTVKLSTSRGSQFSIAEKKSFRKGMETIIGLKMAQNAVLSDDDRDIIMDYEFHLNRIKSMTEKLDGDGKDKKGLNTEFKAVCSSLDGINHKIKSLSELLESTPEQEQQGKMFEYLTDSLTSLDERATEFKALKNDLKKQINNSKDLLKKSEDFTKNNKEKYDTAIAKIAELK